MGRCAQMPIGAVRPLCVLTPEILHFFSTVMPTLPRAWGRAEPRGRALSGRGRYQAAVGSNGPGDALAQAKQKSCRYLDGVSGTLCLTEKTSRCF